MGRSKQPEIRARLLAQCTDHALSEGLPDRLSPFVAATGATARVLLYHFGTKDKLLQEVLREARRRQRRDFGALLRPRDDMPYPAVLSSAWDGISGERGQGYLRIFGRLRVDEEQHLWPGFRLEATTDWLDPLREGLNDIGLADRATLVLAVIRGLILDLEATGDARRVRGAWVQFIGSLEP